MPQSKRDLFFSHQHLKKKKNSQPVLMIFHLNLTTEYFLQRLSEQITPKEKDKETQCFWPSNSNVRYA